MKIRIIALLLALSTVVSAFAACGKVDTENTDTTSSKSVETTKKTVAAASPYISDGVLMAGVATSVPPYGFSDENGYPDGFDISFANLLGAKLNADTVIENLKYDELIGNIETFIEIAVCAIPEGTKSDNITFSKPYYTAKQTLLVKSDSSIDSVSALNGKTVGIRPGTEENFKSQKFSGAKQMVIYDLQASAAALKSGEVDALLVDVNMAAKLLGTDNSIKKASDIKVSDISYVVAMPTGDAALEKAINDAISLIISEGELASAEKKYFG